MFNKLPVETQNFASLQKTMLQKIRIWGQQKLQILKRGFKNIFKKQRHDDRKLVHILVKKTDGKFPKFKQLKYFHKAFNKQENKLFKVISTIFVISALVFCVAFYLHFSEIIPKSGGEYTEGLVGTPQYINPIFSQVNDLDADLSSLTFAGLFRYDPTHGLKENIIDTWELSEDQKTYTFKIKKDILWHDENKLTVDDIIFTIKKIKDPNVKSPLYVSLVNVAVEKIDNQNFRLTLEEPFAPFLETLVFGILPKHVWKEVDPANFRLAAYNLKPIGNGPYKFSSLTKEQNGVIKTFHLERFNDFFDKKPYLKKLNFKFYNSFEQAVQALNNKNVEGLSYLPKGFSSKIANHGSFNFHQLQLPQYTALFFNKEKNSILNSKGARQSLAQALDKEKLVDQVLEQEAQKIDSPILPGSLGFTDDAKKYTHNPEEVKKQLINLGWTLKDYEAGEDEEEYPFQVRKKGSTYFELTITTIDQSENVTAAEFIQKAWQSFGIKTNLQILDKQAIQQAIIERAYDVLLYSEILSYDPDPYPFWHSSQAKHPGLNLALYKSAKADKYLETARKTSDVNKRAENYTAFQKLISKDLPTIFLYSPTYTYPQLKKIKGFNAYNIIIPANRFSNITDWYIKTKRDL